MSTLMPAKRLDPLQPFYDDFFRSFKDILPNDGWTSGMRSTMPAANITEQKDAFEVSLAAPGMKKEDFKVDIEGGMLTVSAEKEKSTEDRDSKFTRREYSYSSFSRSFTLPEDIDRNAITAAYQDGILKLALPKKPEARKLETGRHIKVS